MLNLEGKDLHGHIARITSDNVDPGGQLTLNLERICEHITRITSDNVDLGGRLTCSTWKGSTKTLQGLPLTMLILGVGQLMLNLERICEHIARITSDNVDPGEGRSMLNLERIHANTLQGLPLTKLILGGGSIDSQLGNDPQKTLQGLPLTMLILGGLINSQLGKDP